LRKAPNDRPALLAEAAAAIDELAGGRPDLGIGAGSNEMEHRVGIPVSPLRERMDG
jgi:alkanesulfonate monooxygenase SsuD/methylene tetrahydromethanopterin reductase-like flavin-dependent oxidoreductase (luciferase family)